MGENIEEVKCDVIQRFKGIADEDEFKLRYMIGNYERIEGLRHNFSYDVDGLCSYFAGEFLKWIGKPISKRHGNSLDRFEKVFSHGFEEVRVNVGDVSWLESREDECFVAWVACRKYRGGKRYNDFGLPLRPAVHKEIYTAVKEFLVFLDITSRGKEEFVDNIRDVLSRLDESSKMFSWVKDNDDDFISWLVEYLDGKDLMEGLSSLPVSCDRVKVFKTAFFLWEAHPDTKTIFLRSARAAWSQRKFRESNRDNGRLNTYIGKKAKQALVNLADDDGVKIKDVLNKLIMNEYDRRKK
ncbi:hypothetical protein [Zobellella iuensis]|uniref:Uncharacterized protein n=1 Tax=Zobellella iuensis TaxID=2803811 RepID=A0ABS1QPL1_9GAMM|nr:hypothetical protein [Zobellella iuensis]MBL1376457.1 hypothetical protein [Zobellella iuensis]